jgi:pilus assembly protein CpaC
MFSGAQKMGGVAKVFFGMLAAALVLLVATGRPTAAQPIETLNLSIGDAHIIETQFDLADIIVGDEEVARIALLSARSLAVTPLSAGATQVILRDESGALRRRVSIVVDENFAPLQRIINEIQPGSGVTVRSVNGRVVISGTVRDAAEAERVRGIAESYSEVTVVDALKIADPQQITLKVNILELSRSGGKELGINTFRDPQGTDGVNGTPFGVVTGNLDFAINNRSFSVDILLQALENKGLARRLANPTLVAVNGTTASFVVGGEVPVVTTDEDGTAITDYREYGVKLSFTPQVLSQRMIRLAIEPEVSEVDWSRRVNDNPAFTSRKVNTTIELASGDSFAIAGLLQQDSVRSARQFPWLADVPILGALFRSSAYQKNETELVVVVTPTLVNAASGRNAIGDPTLKAGDVSDADMFLLGLMENNDEMTRRFKSGFGVTGAFGHILPSK